MFYSYNTQKVVHEDRVRSLIESAQPLDVSRLRPLARILATLRGGVSETREQFTITPVQVQNPCNEREPQF